VKRGNRKLGGKDEEKGIAKETGKIGNKKVKKSR
jgi:hypothetical protein